MQARHEEESGEKKTRMKNRPNTTKRLASEAMGVNRPSPEAKRQKINGRMETLILPSPKVKQKL